MSRRVRRVFRRRAAALAVLLVGCGATTDGLGVVEGDFTVVGCTAGEDRAFPAYRFDAQHVVTKRFDDHLEIVLLRYPVDLEETDGMVVQLDGVTAVRAAAARVAPAPLSVSLGAGNNSTRAALSLFESCPRAPTLHAVTGTLTFTRLVLAERPEDTGKDELVTGVLTATVAGPDRTTVLGRVSARFDFEPDNAPLLTPR